MPVQDNWIDKNQKWLLWRNYVDLYIGIDNVFSKRKKCNHNFKIWHNIIFFIKILRRQHIKLNKDKPKLIS
jgi:hypothetical protein